MSHARGLLAILAGLLLFIQPAAADTPVYARLAMPIFFEAEIPRDIQLVSDAVNEIAQEKIGASVELVPLLYMYGRSADPRRMAELEMLEKQGTVFDLYPDVLPNMKKAALEKLLELYGRDILALIGEFRFDFAREEGTLYSLSSISDYVASAGITMRKDIIDKYEIDISRITSLADLDEVFDFLSQREPDMKMICTYQTRMSFLARFKHVIAVPSSILDVSGEDPTRIINYYATDTYRETVERIRGWHEKGYMPEYMALQNMRASQFVNAGELFAYICAYKPGIDYEESTSCGREMITVPLMESIITRRSLNLTQWCVSESCANPGKAVQFLSLLYTDPEMVNLLVYGIEGVHYVVQPDGTINYPEGVSAETVGYQNTLAWLLPNQMISHVWQGNDPEVWEKTRIYNETAPVSETLWFKFDSAGVRQEYDKLNEIVGKYAYGLETGQLDPDLYLSQMLLEMEQAGAARVIEEAQAQFNTFLEEKQTDEYTDRGR